MKNINKGIGYLAIAAIAITSIIVTASVADAFLIVTAGFFLVGFYA